MRGPHPGALVSPEQSLAEAKSAVFQTLLDCLDMTAIAKLPPGDARAHVSELMGEIFRLGAGAIPPVAQAAITAEICDDLFGLGPLESLLAQDGITDIMVNGLDAVYIERDGQIERTHIGFVSREQLLTFCQRAVARAGRRVDEASPFCDARLPDGSRVNVILPPLAVDGPVMTIRKFRKERLTFDRLEALGTFGNGARRLLEILARCRCNILVTGGSGSGKTTLLNGLAGAISETERIITCEDAAELRLQQPHVVRLETRPANAEGAGAVTMADLVRNALRMRPDRIVVGEVRGAEALDLLQAMNTGHDGSMGTLHANSPEQAITRLEALALMGAVSMPRQTLRRLIAGGIDIIVHLARLKGGERRLMRVAEIADGGDEDDIVLLDLFRVGPQGGGLACEATPRLREKMQAAGLEASLADILRAGLGEQTA